MTVLPHPEVTMEDSSLHSLKALHTAAIDARNGYQEALAEAEGTGLRSLFTQMATLHGQNAEELREALVGAGEQPDGSGSFMSKVHEAIMDIRSLFGGLGESVLPGLIDGEERNLSRYDGVLGDAAQRAAPVRELLRAQRDRISLRVAAMRAEWAQVKAAS